MAQTSLVSPVTSVIAANVTLGATVQTGGGAIMSITADANFSGTALTFNVAADPAAASLAQMRKSDSSGAYSIAISAGQTLPVPAADFAGYSQVQPVSGTTQSSTASTITFGVRGV